MVQMQLPRCVSIFFPVTVKLNYLSCLDNTKACNIQLSADVQNNLWIDARYLADMIQQETRETTIETL